MLPLEIKSGATVAGDYFAGLDHFAKLGTSRPWGSGLVYGGESRQSRTGVRVVPVAEMASLFPDPATD